jgi:hypothetical protein
MISQGTNQDHERSKLAQSESLKTVALHGARPCNVNLNKQMFEVLQSKAPEVLEKIWTVISEFKVEWPPELRRAATEHGQGKAKRAVNLDLPEDLVFTDAQGNTHTGVSIQVVGILFTEDDLKKQTPHQDRRASLFLKVEELLSVLNDVPVVRQAIINLKGGKEGLAQWLLSQSKYMDVDADGYPVFSQSKVSLLGGHGAKSAKNKYDYATDVLPEFGLKVPLALGYGEYTETKFQINGNKLGVYLAVIRNNEPERLGDWLANESERELEVQRKIMVELTKSLVDDISHSDSKSPAYRVKLESAHKEIDKAAHGSSFFPLAQHRLAMYSYGRALRRVMGDDLSNLESMVIPARFPHIGNLAVDIKTVPSAEKIDVTWYDLGGWKFGRDMTRNEAFLNVYATLDFALMQVFVGIYDLLGGVESSEERLKAMKYRPEEELLKGFFFDRLKDPDFIDWKVFRVGNRLNTSATFMGYISYDTPKELPPPCERYEMPFVRLLGKMMGLPVPKLVGVTKEEVGRLVKGHLSKQTLVHRLFTKNESKIIERLHKTCEHDVVTVAQIEGEFSRFGIVVKDRSSKIAEAINSIHVARSKATRVTSYEPPTNASSNKREEVLSLFGIDFKDIENEVIRLSELRL